MRHRLRGTLAMIVAGSGLVNPVIAQSSANYMMERVGLAAGVSSVASQSYQMSVILIPDSRTGASSTCNTGLRISLGFWAVPASIPVPTDLSVRHSPADPQDVELTWTGADPLFQIYRGSSPSDISIPMNLYEETGLCAFTDALAHQEPILFYLVLPRP